MDRARIDRTDSRELTRATPEAGQNRWESPARTLATFRLGGDLFGIDVELVKEVAEAPPLTLIPHAPAAVRGCANRRGQIILILDLRTLLDRDATDIGPETRLVTFKPELGDPFGVLVDRIGEVLPVRLDEIDAQVENATGGATPPHYELVAGVAKLAGDLVTILDPRKFLPNVEQAIRGRGQGARQDLNPAKERNA
jgi:purine-binding chemotaxis protein CheW